MQTIHGNGRRLILTLAGIVLLAAALALTSVFSRADDASSVAQSQTAATSSPAESGSDLGVLRSGGAVSISDVPESVSSALSLRPATEDGRGRGVVEGLGVVPGGSPRSEVVVAEVSQKICVFATGTEYRGAAVGSCFSAAEVEAGTGFVAVQGVLADGLVRVIGIAPDGVVRVSIDSGDDGQADAAVDVSANVYQADLETVPTVAAGLSSDGKVEFETKMPLSSGGHYQP